MGRPVPGRAGSGAGRVDRSVFPATDDRSDSPPPTTHVEDAQQVLQAFAADLSAFVTGLREQGSEVPAALVRRIEEAARRIPLRPEVPIALVGGTGSDKSTLVNALLDSFVVPISTTRACTSAVTEIAWSGSGYHSATIEFISRAEWLDELDLLMADPTDATSWVTVSWARPRRPRTSCRPSTVSTVPPGSWPRSTGPTWWSRNRSGPRSTGPMAWLRRHDAYGD